MGPKQDCSFNQNAKVFLIPKNLLHYFQVIDYFLYLGLFTDSLSSRNVSSIFHLFVYLKLRLNLHIPSNFKNSLFSHNVCLINMLVSLRSGSKCYFRIIFQKIQIFIPQMRKKVRINTLSFNLIIFSSFRNIKIMSYGTLPLTFVIAYTKQNIHIFADYFFHG